MKKHRSPTEILGLSKGQMKSMNCEARPGQAKKRCDGDVGISEARKRVLKFASGGSVDKGMREIYRQLHSFYQSTPGASESLLKKKSSGSGVPKKMSPTDNGSMKKFLK